MEYVKSVQFNRQDRDYSAVVNGQVISIHSTYTAAQAAADAYVYEALTHTAPDVAETASPSQPAVEPSAAVLAPNRADVAAVIAESRAKAYSNQRWINALNRAYSELETGAWAYNGRVLVVRSRTSATQYRVTANECTCTASQHNRPCWHRAAARLIDLANARRAA